METSAARRERRGADSAHPELTMLFPSAVLLKGASGAPSAKNDGASVVEGRLSVFETDRT